MGPNYYREAAVNARRRILGMVHAAQTSHIASNFSVIDVATVLYSNLKEGDEVVWSPSWKAATMYYFLAEQGKIPKEDLDLFSKEIDGKIPYLGLAETNVPGVWVNGGSVGHGLPVAVGMALAKKRAGEKGNIYCILSDGELNEGSVWEAVMFANHHKLNNLVVLIDANKWQAMGRTSEVCDLEPIENRFEGFGWYWTRLDGHNYKQLGNIFDILTLNQPPMISPSRFPERMKPFVFVCDTIKGKGVSFMENHLLYHYKNVQDDEYEKALAELV